jgi:hypothetical protein
MRFDMVPMAATTIGDSGAPLRSNDRRLQCLLIEDATAFYFPEFTAATLAMIHVRGAIDGWTIPAGAPYGLVWMSDGEKGVEDAVEAAARVAGLDLDLASRDMVRLHFETAERLARSLLAFPLDDDIEPAPVFTP